MFIPFFSSSRMACCWRKGKERNELVSSVIGSTYKVVCLLAERANDLGLAMADILDAVLTRLVLLGLRPLDQRIEVQR